ncbi:MAG: 2-polyprenyl-3-methyl-5-hydroxy-6-metoxy-1,4-benzoquinol methylase [Candidatus Krumholzibacteriia bacterium]|jgi:2-polyprenyl-3-methyl-5-hydroxy-6-metoxy-1,4-benzoquinol methylase
MRDSNDMIAPVKDPAYYGRPRREMRTHVPADAKLILDIGCGAGAFGAGLKSVRNTESETLSVWGIEMDPIAAERASEVLDRVFVGDAADVMRRLANEGGKPEAGFDAVVMNDVLEHVLEPEELLAAASALLRPGGRVVASVPNVRFFGNVVDLVVHGSWEYTDEGILDRTHFRFFTRSSMLAMFARCGYTVEQVTGINPTGSLKFKLMNLLTLGQWSDMKYLQFAIRARRAEK